MDSGTYILGGRGAVSDIARRKQELPLLLGVTVFVGLAGAFIKWVTTPEPVGGDEYDVSVTFQKDGISLRKQAPNRSGAMGQVRDWVARSRIISVAPFKQMGWIFCRERGITIRLDDGDAIFIALRGSKKEFATHLQHLSHALPSLGYTVEKLRSFQP